MSTITAKGYVMARQAGHPNARKDGYIAEHVLIAARALGKALPMHAVVHHHNELKSDNRNSNLVICENDRYHRTIHRRMRLIAMGANPDTETYCAKCKSVLPVEHFGIVASGKCKGLPRGYCLICARLHTEEWRQRKAGIAC